MGFILLVYQATNPSFLLIDVRKLNISGLLSCSLASEETFLFSKTFSETPYKAVSHYLQVTVGRRLYAVAKVRKSDLSLSKNLQSLR